MAYEAALKAALNAMTTDPDRFYGPAFRLPLGAGILLRDCPLPVPDDTGPAYRTGLGHALVLTHECDIDPDNDRSFNDSVLVLPITPLDLFCEQYDMEHGAGAWGGLVPKIAGGEVFRLMYLPPVPAHIAPSALSQGGIVNFNTIGSAPLPWLQHFGTQRVCSLSAIGLRFLDFKIETHLYRPKAVPLWFDQ